MLIEEGHSPVDADIETILITGESGPIVVDDASLLFAADFLRDGPDLVLTSDGAADIRIVDYFRQGAPLDLQAANGSVLRGDTVETLAGPLAPGRYAQVSGSVGAEPIGQVEKVDGEAFVQRTDGTLEPLTPSSKIFQNDVVQTGDGSNLSLTFVDGTIFSLTADSRMIIDELIFAPGGGDNSAAFNLLQGGFVFIAGQVAKTGDMEVNTPAATMGIRGTTVLTDVSVENGVATAKITLTRDPPQDGETEGRVGQVEVFDLEGNLVTTITSTATTWVFSTEDGETREIERTAEDDADDSVLIAEAFAAYQAAVARFSLEGRFLELDNLSRGSSDGETVDQGGEPGADDTNIDLDIQDEESVPEIAPTEAPETDGSTIDESNLDTLPTDLDVERVAVEDSEGGSLTGNLQDDTAAIGDFTVVESTENGSVTLDSDGTYVYVPDPDFNGTDSFVFEVVDAAGDSETGTVTINVLPVNDAPLIEDASVSGLEDQIILGVALATDVDSPSLTYSLQSGGMSGVASVTATGTWAYVPSPDFVGSDSFVIAVSDGDGAVSTQTVSISLANVNDPPVVTNSAAAAQGDLVEDSEVVSASGTLTASDADADAVLTWSGTAPGTLGDLTVNPDGSWSYALIANVNGLAEGQVVTDEFEATVEDETGATATQTITISVTGVNDGPAIVTGEVSAPPILVEDTVTSAEGTFLATDPDDGAVLTWSGSSSGTFGDLTVDPDGAWGYVLREDASQQLAEGAFEVDSFTVTVSDEEGGTATQTLTLKIFGANDAPVVEDQMFSMAVESSLSGTLIATDADKNDVLTFEAGTMILQHGIVTIEPDGSFVYLHNQTLGGIDTFDVTVTDSAGATSTATATIIVEAPSVNLENGTGISLSISTEPGEDGPAGLISVDTTFSENTSVNFVVAMDSSDTVGPGAWNEQITVLFGALETLKSEFDGAVTEVHVTPIVFSSTAMTLGTFELSDPNLLSAIGSQTHLGGAADWNAALQAAETHFDANATDADNILYVLTNGSSVSEDWIAVRDRLIDPDVNDYAVDLTAFAIGETLDLTGVSDLDPTARALSDSSDLANGFPPKAIFAPELDNLSVQAIVDGEGLGQVANLSTPGVSGDDLGTTLPLADIPNLASLLGTDNLFSVSVGFELEDRDIELSVTEFLTPRETAQTLDGTDDSDLLFGSDLADTLDGNGGNDILFGFAGDDVLTTGAGIDYVDAGEGDDRIVIDGIAAPTPGFANTIDGGLGRDVLDLQIAGDLSADVLPLVDLSGIEALDMDNAQANSLTLALSDILSASSEADAELEALLGTDLPESLTVYGDGADSLQLTNGETGGFVDTGTSATDADGNTLDVYTYVDGGSVLATLAVDSEVAVTTAPATP